MIKIVRDVTKKKPGIDVSYWQGIIDWKKVKAAGIEFALIRAGYGSSADKKFLENIKGAIEAGLEIGVYWFIYATSTEEAIKNAVKCAELVAPYKDKIRLGIAADYEYDSDSYFIRTGKKTPTKAVRTQLCIEFMSKIESLGYQSTLYANPDYIKTKFNMDRLSKYPLWLAWYSGSYGNYLPAIWQYSSVGKVAGIKGNVDMNYGFYSIQGETITPTPTPQTQPTFTAIKAQQEVSLKAVPLYGTSKTSKIAGKISGRFYIWNASVINGRVRITNRKENCGVVTQVTGWIKAEDL